MTRIRTTIAAFAAGMLLLAALASGAGAADTGTTKKPVATIGVIAPLNAGLTSFGHGIRDSVKLAVQTAVEDDLVPGVTLKVRALDDSSDPAVGARAARKLAADPTVIAVIGPYNSGVAERIAPILAAKDIALISPSNTLTSLTLGANANAPERPYPNYFRMVGPDAVQAKFLAARAHSLGFTRAAVVSETKAVSKDLADLFAAAFQAGGGTVVDRTVVPDGATAAQFSGFVTAALQASPDFVFFGGEYQVAATLRTTLTKGGVTVPLMGGDGMKDPEYISTAGADATGSYASGTGLPTDTLAGGNEFLAAYAKAGFKTDPTNYGPYSYDATTVVLDALKQLSLGSSAKLPSNARSRLIAAVQSADEVGITGRVAFDDYGDTLDPQFTLYRVAGSPGAWVALPAA